MSARIPVITPGRDNHFRTRTEGRQIPGTRGGPAYPVHVPAGMGHGRVVQPMPVLTPVRGARVYNVPTSVPTSVLTPAPMFVPGPTYAVRTTRAPVYSSLPGHRLSCWAKFCQCLRKIFCWWR
jgi:hypothetical protein